MPGEEQYYIHTCNYKPHVRVYGGCIGMMYLIENSEIVSVELIAGNPRARSWRWKPTQEYVRSQ
jgi:hypothetical protein